MEVVKEIGSPRGQRRYKSRRSCKGQKVNDFEEIVEGIEVIRSKILKVQNIYHRGCRSQRGPM